MNDTIDPSLVPLYIDGARVLGQSGERFANIDPSTGRERGQVALATAVDVDRAVAAAKRAQPAWARIPSSERLALVAAIADGIVARADEFIAAEVADSGMPLGLAKKLVLQRSAQNMRIFAQSAADMPGVSLPLETPDGGRALSYSLRVPLGVVGLICPWNLPLAMLTWKLAPALIMGNSVIVKPSDMTPTTATLLGDVVKAVGIPDGVYNVVHGPGSTGQAVVAHPDVAAISFTGGTETGRAIMAAAAPAMKKLSLELGGKNPAIVFADADLARTIPGLARSIFAHSGQTCLSMERIYVERPIYDRVVTALVAAAGRMVPGPPMSSETNLGPVVSAAQRDKILAYQRTAVEEGAEVVAGGGVFDMEAPYSGGYYVKPTVLVHVPPGSSVDRDEIFGPICSVHPFDSAEEAIARANDCRYGLAASVWTDSGQRAAQMAAALDVGVVWLNAWLVRDLRMPFGGVKDSGIGREGGVYSLDFFSQLRSVTMMVG